MKKLAILVGALPLLAACANSDESARGVTHEETLLSVSASGEADARPDEAVFMAGVETWGSNAKTASANNAEGIAKVVAALKELGIPEDDIQTRSVGVRRIDWGDRKGQYGANNTVTVTVRDMAKAGEAVTAVTEVGANVMSGPDLRMSDPEGQANAAYAEAYKAARTRAEAYAEAAGMEISRVLYIRDAGGSQGGRYFQGAVPVAPPPPPVSPAYRTSTRPESMADASAIMPGQTTSAVTVQVDFALVPK
ncbi:SIMPL domain-containing protein [Croceicoccus naphthovorans]|uniref:Membrane protein n=1 Tax=Croceicoccus naphthovorans TaxID=1348774 RepID=A0A0G3XDN7_9SPHN|nr:SIMPL domain-containing protein [Croceicoccus naphthovorans]AKM09307.1 membrane protein [Croceicoccus naphthovorans]MBB3990213.1 hypothetical protein [Croceicoccus naphthovorans]